MKIIFSIITLVILFIFLGFVSYEGFTSKPKSYATKTIYAEIVKYTKDEIKKETDKLNKIKNDNNSSSLNMGF